MNQFEQPACCFSGHRKIESSLILPIEAKLRYEICRLIDMGVYNYLAGGAVGFDTIAALTVLSIKKGYNDNIKLHLALPCRNQHQYFSEEQKRIYNYIAENADSITYCSDAYFDGVMQMRDRFMVDNSCWCICYLDTTGESKGGGTAYTVKYAQKKNLEIVNIF